MQGAHLRRRAKSMKRTMTIAEISAVLLLMLFALSGCGSPQEKADEAPAGLTAGEPAGLSGEPTGLSGEPTGLSGETTGQNTDNAQSSPDTDEVPLSLDALQGHWVDVNGDTTLDFAGDQMTVHWGSYEDLLLAAGEIDQSAPSYISQSQPI